MLYISKPFQAKDDFVVEVNGKWYRFPTYDEAWEFYEAEKGGM